MPLLNHFIHHLLINFLSFLLLSPELSVKEVVELATINPKKPPIPLHQGLILRLYHSHLVLCPPKPIRTTLVNEEPKLNPPIETPQKPSITIKSRSKCKLNLPANQPTPNTTQNSWVKRKKRKKNNPLHIQRNVAVGLCELKNISIQKAGKHVKNFFISFHVEEPNSKDEEGDANTNATSYEDARTTIEPEAGV